MPSVEVGKVYAAQAASEWHRVRVESIVDDTCLCLFLDHGDTDTIALADLRDLKPEFLMLPPQAFPVEVEDSSSALSSPTVTLNTWSGHRPPGVPADRLENTSNSEPAPAWQVVDGQGEQRSSKLEEEIDAEIFFPRWKTVLPLVLDLV